MKKIIVALTALVALASADGLVAGLELGYGKVDASLTATPGGSASADTNTVAVTAKGGYQIDNIKLMGYVTSEKYSDDMIVAGEGRLLSYGVEADYMLDKAFVGLAIGQGNKDFGVDVGFKDVAVRGGMLMDNVELGVQLKKRTYDSYDIGVAVLDMDDTIVSVFIGIGFNL